MTVGGRTKVTRRAGKPVVVLIASWLEPQHVERIRQAAPGRIEVRYEPDLLPTPRDVADHTAPLRALTPQELERWRTLLAEGEVLFDFDWMDPGDIPRTAPGVRWVQATSAGIGEFLAAKGLMGTDIVFTTASGVHAVPLAEFVLLALLYFAKDVPRLRESQARRHWQRQTTRELTGSRVVVVGLGAVGREVARRCAALGLEVWATRLSKDGTLPEGVKELFPLSALREALSHADALVLACPLTAQTRGLIGPAELAALPETAVIVNISRGQVLDEAALISALESGRLRGAALDVFQQEPLHAGSPLWGMRNVLISPHSASTVAAENDRIIDIFVENLRRYLDGRPLLNRFDPVRGY